MIVPKSLKLNRFRQVPIPRNRDYFGNRGSHSIPAKSMYSGDEVIPLANSKVRNLADTEKLIQKMEHKEE
jgi:hypothetical protein